MEISYDPEKRATTLADPNRRLDFDDAVQVFAGSTIDVLDDRKDYGEVRWVTYGILSGRMVALVWTPRGEGRHIISMRKANEREKKIYEEQLDRSG
jgi:uncharacterized DUF497 family protein